MTLAAFFNSFAGMYVAQSFCHSIIAAVISDRAIKAWKIDDPAIRQRFRVVALLLPMVLFPIYQMLNPDRSSVLFRLDSLFDINRWLSMEIFGMVPVSLLLLALLGFTTLVFLFQEMFPIVRHSFSSHPSDVDGTPLDIGPFLDTASRTLGIKKPDIIAIEEDDPFLFSTTGKDPAIYVSTGLVRTLTEDQLHAAIAHEIAHIARSRRPLLIVIFLLRILMFFNPVILVQFRRIVRNEEKICDDIAVSMTDRPSALIAALKIFLHKPVASPGEDPAATSIEDYSHALSLEGRIQRLESGQAGMRENWIVPYALTIVAIACLNYFIV